MPADLTNDILSLIEAHDEMDGIHTLDGYGAQIDHIAEQQSVDPSKLDTQGMLDGEWCHACIDVQSTNDPHKFARVFVLEYTAIPGKQ